MTSVDHIPGTKQMSTVISDALLAAASYNCAWLVYPRNQLGALGLLSIGLAATAGVFRYACFRLLFALANGNKLEIEVAWPPKFKTDSLCLVCAISALSLCFVVL